MSNDLIYDIQREIQFKVSRINAWGHEAGIFFLDLDFPVDLVQESVAEVWEANVDVTTLIEPN